MVEGPVVFKDDTAQYGVAYNGTQVAGKPKEGFEFRVRPHPIVPVGGIEPEDIQLTMSDAMGFTISASNTTSEEQVMR